MNWIPMKKFQPMREGWYLVTLKDTGNTQSHVVETDYWDDLGECWDIFKDSVLAWTELPEPYREAQNG